MQNRLAPAALVAAIGVAACGDDGGGAPPPPPASTGGNASTGSGGRSSTMDGSAPDSGEAGAGGAGTGGAIGSGGTGGQAMADASPDAPEGSGGAPPDGDSGVPTTTACPQKPVLTGAARLDVSTASDDTFGSVTPDERVIAWTVIDGDAVTLHYASRSTPAQPFGAAQSLSIDAAPDAVALGPDGLRAVYVNPDRRGFSVLTRPSRGAAFAPAATTEFSLFEAEPLPVGEMYGDPVITSNDYRLYYSRFGGGRTKTLHASNRISPFAPWPVGGGVSTTSRYDATGSARVRPTGTPGDDSALFLFDEAAQTQIIAFFASDSGVLDAWEPLSGPVGAAPNGACDRLYYAQSDGSVDLFVADLDEAP